jgi:type IV fimbrial biogenesis protein FimT
MRKTSRHFDSRRAGFTLFELILVVVIIALVAGMAAPSLRNWSRGSSLRDASDNFLGAIRAGRTAAAMSGVSYQLNIDSQSGRYWLSPVDSQQQQQQASASIDDYSMPVNLPEGVRIQAVGPSNQPMSAIRFDPTGRTDPASITLMTAEGSRVTIACATPVEDFAVVQEQSR